MTSNSTPIGSDDSPFDHNVPIDWRYKPAFMYVHWLRGEQDPIAVFLFQISDPDSGISSRDIRQAIKAIEIQAATPVPLNAKGRVEWRALSYMVFVLTEPGAKFKDSGVRFQHGDGNKNHTFFDPQIVTDTESGFSVFYCTNFRRKKNGDVLGHASEPYSWISDHSEPASFDVKIHTDSGQNTGP
jgi:hypothetical protein